MSLQAAKDFLNKLTRSKTLQKEVQEAAAKGLVDLGRDHGYDFTPAELKRAHKHRDKDHECSDDWMIL